MPAFFLSDPHVFLSLPSTSSPQLSAHRKMAEAKDIDVKEKGLNLQESARPYGGQFTGLF